MTSREKVLAGAVGLLVAMWGGSSMFSRYRDAVEDNRAALRDAEQELSQAKTAKLRGQRAMTKLRRWQKQSLPSNPDIANSLYQDWLQKQFNEAGVKVSEIKASTGLRAPNDRFQSFSYAINATGEMSQLVDFLSRFYRAGHLHRISRAELTPAKEGETISITLNVDALAMRDSQQSNRLSDLPSTVELPPLEELQASIAKRRPFAPYQKPAEKATSVAVADNQADQAVVSGMILGQEGWQMSVRMKDSGNMLYFRTGDSIQIGKFSGKVSEINGRRAILEIDGSRKQVQLGQTIGQAQPFTDNAG